MFLGLSVKIGNGKGEVRFLVKRGNKIYSQKNKNKKIKSTMWM